MKQAIDERRLEQMRALRDAIHERREVEARSTHFPPIVRPISFNDAMIVALHAGRKTQTRRLMRGTVASHRKIGGQVVCLDSNLKPIRCHLGESGDELWVRERWSVVDPRVKPLTYLYGDNSASDSDERVRWKPSFHMPRVASRTMLLIQTVRAQRLHEITESDARAEGFDPRENLFGPIEWFRDLWNGLFAEPDTCWNANPWVWVIEFSVVAKVARTQG